MTRARPALGGGWTLWPHLLVRGAGFPFAQLDEVFRAADVAGALRKVAADPKFREAVTWQNRTAVADGLDSLLRRPAEATDSKTRKKQLLVARYLQRYCAKNDTIGFFGPVGWATAGGAPCFVVAPGLSGSDLDPDPPFRPRPVAPRFMPGPELLAARQAYFEPWAVKALARACTAEERLKAPVTLPGDLRIVGGAVLAPGASWKLTKDELRVVRAADGRSAEALLRSLAGEGSVPTNSPGAARAALDSAGRRSRAAERNSVRIERSRDASFANLARWREVLERLAADGVLRWGWPVALSLEPERAWRALAASPGLEALRAKRDAVVSAAGDDRTLGAALQAMEAVFEAQTAIAAKRHEGRTYGGRGLVFEECRRAMTMDVGSAPVERVAPALRVVLQVARWYTFSIARRLAGALLARHRKLGGGRIPLHVFWAETGALFEEEVPPAVAAVAKQLRTRWNALWALAEVRDDGVHLDEASALELAEKKFAAPGPGWPGARHHAPDLMWDAASPEAMLRGEGTPVLAELHPGVTPLTTLSVLSLCPVREALEAEWAEDFPAAMVSPIPWEDFARSSQDARLAKRHWHLDVGGEFVSERSPEEVLRAADFDVVERRGRLVAMFRGRARAGAVLQRPPEFDLLQVFERRIKLRAAVGFSLSDGADSGPRRYLGPLLVQRAHWKVTAGAECSTGTVHAWRHQLGLPDRVFVRSPEEVKPIYVDFASPVSVEMLVRLARHAEHLSISEMYPGPEGLWLRDAEGRSYVSELRLIAVDPQPFDAAQVWR